MTHENGRQQPLEIGGTWADSPTAVIEALLFVSSEGETVARLAAVLDWPPATVQTAVAALERELLEQRRGIHLQRTGDRLQLVSSPAYGPVVNRLLGLERTLRLSGAAVETLAFVAYRQPATRGEIETVRGVDSGSVVATLLARELIAPVGRRSTPGNPTEYGTTAQFLQAFGLASLDELPDLGSLVLPTDQAGVVDEPAS